jgi:hypothetical protein
LCRFKKRRIPVFPDKFQRLLIFPVLIPVLLKESMDNPAFSIIRTVSTGIQFLLHKAAAFHGTPGCPEIPRAVIISQLTAFAGSVL